MLEIFLLVGFIGACVFFVVHVDKTTAHMQRMLRESGDRLRDAIYEDTQRSQAALRLELQRGMNRQVKIKSIQTESEESRAQAYTAILRTLKEADEPLTAEVIAERVAQLWGVDVGPLADPMLRTLEAVGLAAGLDLYREPRRYSLAPRGVDAVADSDAPTPYSRRRPPVMQ